jgi:hypothetical protein
MEKEMLIVESILAIFMRNGGLPSVMVERCITLALVILVVLINDLLLVRLLFGLIILSRVENCVLFTFVCGVIARFRLSASSTHFMVDMSCMRYRFYEIFLVILHYFLFLALIMSI